MFQGLSITGPENAPFMILGVTSGKQSPRRWRHIAITPAITLPVTPQRPVVNLCKGLLVVAEKHFSATTGLLATSISLSAE